MANKAMTDAEKYVRSIWPNASCFEANLYWPGQGHRRRWIVLSSPIMSRSEAQGMSEIEAWANAANKLEAPMANEADGTRPEQV